MNLKKFFIIPILVVIFLLPNFGSGQGIGSLNLDVDKCDKFINMDSEYHLEANNKVYSKDDLLFYCNDSFAKKELKLGNKKDYCQYIEDLDRKGLCYFRRKSSIYEYKNSKEYFKEEINNCSHISATSMENISYKLRCIQSIKQISKMSFVGLIFSIFAYLLIFFIKWFKKIKIYNILILILEIFIIIFSFFNPENIFALLLFTGLVGLLSIFSRLFSWGDNFTIYYMISVCLLIFISIIKYFLVTFSRNPKFIRIIFITLFILNLIIGLVQACSF